MSFPRPVFDQDQIWSLLLAIRAEGFELSQWQRGVCLGVNPQGQLMVNDTEFSWLVVSPDGHFESALSISAEARQTLELFLPLLAQPLLVIGQLGQSLDGKIATKDGDSFFVTGDANLDHLHRLRAIVDAVLVGTETALCDNPRLTTRRVSGNNPVRVVIDCDNKLPDHLNIFQDNGARTLVICSQPKPANLGTDMLDWLHLPLAEERQFSPLTLIEVLRARGLNRLLVEGGGITVSRFLLAGGLDRLHLAVAPILVGDGRPGLTMPPVAKLIDAMRPHSKAHLMGQDVLFDLNFSAQPKDK